MLSKLQEQHTFPRAPTGARLEPPVSPGQHQETPSPESDVRPAHTSTPVAWYWPSPPAEGELHTHCEDLAPTLLCKSHRPDPIPRTSGKPSPGLEPKHRQGPPPRPGNRQPGHLPSPSDNGLVTTPQEAFRG